MSPSDTTGCGSTPAMRKSLFPLTIIVADGSDNFRDAIHCVGRLFLRQASAVTAAVGGFDASLTTCGHSKPAQMGAQPQLSLPFPAPAAREACRLRGGRRLGALTGIVRRD